MSNELEILYLRIAAAIEAEKVGYLKRARLTPAPPEETFTEANETETTPQRNDASDQPHVTEIWAGAKPKTQEETPAKAETDSKLLETPANAPAAQIAPASDAEAKHLSRRLTFAARVLKYKKRLNELRKRRDYVNGMEKAQQLILREYRRIVKDRAFADYLADQKTIQSAPPEREPIRRG